MPIESLGNGRQEIAYRCAGSDTYRNRSMQMERHSERIEPGTALIRHGMTHDSCLMQIMNHRSIPRPRAHHSMLYAMLKEQ